MALETALDDFKVPEFSFTAERFLDRMTAVYGSTGTGKTEIIKAIMHVLRPHIDQVLVVSPSQPSNQAYSGYVHPVYIRYKVGPERSSAGRGAKTKEDKLKLLTDILSRQEMLTSVFRRTTQLGALRTLYEKIPPASRSMDKELVWLDDRRRQHLKKIKEQYRRAPARHGKAVERLEGLVDEAHRRIYRAEIERSRGQLQGLWDTLEGNEKITLKYLQMNPRLLLIFDDCAAELKPLFTTPQFRELFYMGRHSKVTGIITCQDDTDLNTNLRKNAFVSIFTERIVAGSNFERSSNQFPKTIKARASASVASVFGDRLQPYRKMYYIREDPMGINFYHYTAKIAPPELFGSAAVIELAKRVAGEAGRLDVGNPFYEKFRV